MDYEVWNKVKWVQIINKNTKHILSSRKILMFIMDTLHYTKNLAFNLYIFK